MLVDTHCHLNMMVKKAFDVLLDTPQLAAVEAIITQAATHQVSTIINVGTSLPESLNCVALARQYTPVYAAVGIHPNDCTSHWQKELHELAQLIPDKANKIVGIGETGLDRHYPHFNLPRQQDAFKAHIELALTHDIALVVHSRNAYDETLTVLEQYKNDLSRGIIHCFSYDQAFADAAIAMGFVLGIGGTITYPRNEILREVVRAVNLTDIVLETDAPFLPPQTIRGKQNHPQQIYPIAQYIAQLKGISLDQLARQTTTTACTLFRIPS